jgi:O-Antigen ligase
LSNGEPNREPRVDPVAAIVWVALILGTVLDFRVPIHGGGPGREINLSLFDLALPIALAYAAITRRIVFELIPWRVIAGLVLAAIVISVHSAIAYRYGTWTPIPRLAGPVEVVRLARETIKLVTIPVELAMLMVLFTAEEFRLPPVWVVMSAASVVSAIVVLERIRFLSDNVPYFANIEAHTLAGIMVLAIWILWPGRSANRLIVLGITIGVTLVMVIAFRKTYLMVCGVILIVLIVSFIRNCIEQKNYRPLRRLGFLLAGAITLVIGVQLVMTELFYTGRAPLEFIWYVAGHSSEIRFEIQDVAWHLALVALPFGIGVGQFGALIPRIPELEDYAIAFAHNTPLSLFLDMGVVGLALAVGLFNLIYLACRGGDGVTRLTRLAFFVIPMMVNDTHGLRMTILLLAFFGVASSFASTAIPLEASRSWITGRSVLDIGLLLLALFFALCFAGSAQAGSTANGSVCESYQDCASGHCAPGPSNSSVLYCIAPERHCAAPGHDGFDLDEVVSIDGHYFRCRDYPPGTGAIWRSYDPIFIKPKNPTVLKVH